MTGSWTVHLPGYTRLPLSLNEQLHWAKAARIKKQLGTDAWAMLRHHKVPKGLQRVSVELHYRPSVRRARDEDNCSPTLKVICDAVVKFGVVPDDSHEFLTSGSRIDAVVRDAALLYFVVTDLS